jgi:hypothetical protein
MGQCKSKALEEGGCQDPGAARARKGNKRKWRKSKGYSLSASMEGDLHCEDEDRLVRRGTRPKNGLVLVSYSVTDLENRRPGPQEQRNSFHSPASSPSHGRLVSEERGAPEWEEATGGKKSPPIAEPEGDLSCYSTPARDLSSLLAGPPSPPPLAAPSPMLDVAIVPAPSLYLEERASPQADSVSLDSFASADRLEEVDLSPEGRPSPGPSPLPAGEKPSVTFAEPEDWQPEDGPAGAQERICSGPRAAVVPAAPQSKRTSVIVFPDLTIVSSQQSRVSVPVPANIGSILKSGLAPLSFLDEAPEQEEKRDDALHVIVQPPLIFSEGTSPTDLPTHDNPSPCGTRGPWNLDGDPSGPADPPAAKRLEAKPLGEESASGWREHETAVHGAELDARGESSPGPALSDNGIGQPADRKDDADTPGLEGDPQGQDRKMAVGDNAEAEHAGSTESRYTTVTELRKMFLGPASSSQPCSAAPPPAVSPVEADWAQPGPALLAPEAPEAPKYSDSRPKGEGGTSPSVTAVPAGERAGRGSVCRPRDASEELLKVEDALARQFDDEIEQSEIADEFTDDNGEDGSLGNETGFESVQRGRNASGDGREDADIMDISKPGEEEGGTDAWPVAQPREEVAGVMPQLAAGAESRQEGSDKSCKGSEGQASGMHQEACPGTYAREEEDGEESDVPFLSPPPVPEQLVPTHAAPVVGDKNSIPSSCGDSIGGVKNSDMVEIRKQADSGDGRELDDELGGTRRSRVVSFSLDLVSHEDMQELPSPDDPSSASSEELCDSLTDETPKVADLRLEHLHDAEEDAATLSDISPISDFAALPELPVEEEWACLAHEAALATGGLRGRLPGLAGWGADDDDRTIMDDTTDVSFSLPMDPTSPGSQVDSCLDLTSPTPSQSTSTSSSTSWQQMALAQSGYPARLPPQGCSGSSEEDEGCTGLGDSEDCYDSLEDLKRGAGVRRLPAVPPTPARRDLARSQTFSTAGPEWQAGRRRLPAVPPRAVSVAGREQGSGREDRQRRAVSVGREVGRRSRVETVRSPETSLDSGCHSLQSCGEETSVDPPSLELLPRRNASNFLWVDFQEEEQSAVVRRPKNHDRLVAARKAQNRHSAPPGSLQALTANSCQKKSSLGGGGGRPQKRRPQGSGTRMRSSIYWPPGTAASFQAD